MAAPDGTGRGGRTLCPSAQPEWPGARVVGVVGGEPDAPRLGYLADSQPVTPELLALAGEVSPDEVFRFAAPCAGRGCGHFAGGRCRLASKIAAWLPEVVDELPDCNIRPECRWWRQEGATACRRCPQVVTRNLAPSPQLARAADPNVAAP